MGMLEACTGLGYLFGPMIGSGLYSIGGYLLPFYGMATVYLLMFPFLFQTLKKIDAKEASMEEESQVALISAPYAEQASVLEEHKVKMTHLFSTTRFWMGLIGQFLIYFAV